MQIERRITITYRWWNNDLAEIDRDHQDALEETAHEQIILKMSQGYTSGELHDTIRMHDEDGEEGISYQGWWEKETEIL